MAMSGGTAKLVKSGTPSGWPGPINLYVYYKVKSQSIENNTTTLQLGMYVDTPDNWDIGPWSDYYGSYVGTATSGANCKTFSGAIPNFDGTRWLVENQEVTVSHNADGTKTATIYWKWGVSSSWGDFSNPSGSFNVTLTTIPRASSFTVSSASVDMGSAVTFNITRASSAFTHTLTLTWGSKTSNIGTGIGTSKSWTPPLTLANDLPNSTSSGCTITCITYNGSTEIGRKTLSMTIKVPSSVKPTISSVTISEATSGLSAKFGAYIQHKSKLKAVTAAAGAYSSTIKTYSTKILGVTYSGATITSGIISSSGSVSVAVTVTDSRGRTASKTETVTVLAYTDPTITAFSAQRCNASGATDENGEYVKLTFALAVTSLNSKNGNTYIIEYRQAGAAGYTQLTTGASYSLSSTYLSTSAIVSGDSSYDFRITVTDYFKSVARTADIQTAFTLQDFHASGTAMAIGKVSEEENTLEVALEGDFYEPVRLRDSSYAFQPGAFSGAKGYTLLAVIKLTELNVNAPIVFVINRRGALCPMTVYARFASSSTTTDPALDSLTYEGDNFGAFMVKETTATWKLYVDNTGGWSNPCLQKWFTTDNQRARLSVEYLDEQVAGTDPSVLGTYYRATPAVLRSIIDCLLPVGTIIQRYDHADPNTMYPGTTWVRLVNTFLWASDGSGTIGLTGGAATHTLTASEMPSHSHGSVYSGNASGTKSYAWLASGGSAMAYGTVATGGGAAHNNMPPFTQISAWRRTA